MADVSERLRAARERAGLRIEDIASRTKIKASQLQAIEHGEFDRLPGEFFARAFLKNYAREVALDPEEIVREYDASRRAAEPSVEATRAAESWRALRARGPAPGVLRPPAVDDDPPWRALQFSASRSIGPVFALALVMLILISLMNREPEKARESGAVAGTGASSAAAQPAATSGRPETPPELLSIEIYPSSLIWINAKADGETALYRLVQPGERLKLQARNEMTFRIGNAAAFQYSINGVPGRVLGGPEEVREFQVTRENYRTYRR